MLTIKKILVPVDFSPASEGAARHAAALARHFHSQIVLLHVQKPLTPVMGGIESIYWAADPYDLSQREREELDSFLQTELQEFPVRRVLLEGDPARRIVEFARAEKPDLLVLSTHGYGPFRRFILGSVTAKILHDTEFPVWTGVHLENAPATGSLNIRSVLCAVDLSPHSRQTLCWAARLASEFQARLGIVHATAPLEVSGGRYYSPDWRDLMIHIANEEIEKLQKELGTQAEVYVTDGAAAKVVARAVEDLSADVLIIGRSPGDGRLRTNAYAIIRESPCPVISI